MGRMVMKRRFGVLLACGAASVAVLGGVAKAQAAETLATVADYEMNEPAGATVLVDSGPNQLDGTIGAHVTPNGAYHDFPYHNGAKGGTVDPDHLDLISQDALNPGTADFAISLRLRFTLPVGNVLQKGQSGTVGGIYKVQLDGGNGKVFCRIKGASGGGGVWSPEPINDGQWHTVTCARTADAITITVDGTQSASVHEPTGLVSNSMPLSIGGKSFCKAMPGFDCDYFDGQIDWVKFEEALPDGGPVLSPGRLRWKTFYPYRHDGYRDRDTFSVNAGLQSSFAGGSLVTVSVWNDTLTHLVRRWTVTQPTAGVVPLHVRWAGRNRAGHLVRPGTYQLRASLTLPGDPTAKPLRTPWHAVSVRRGPTSR
jgi:Concanavalin A-like lectin/glucanases superfamily